jgi:protein PhnA
MSKNVCPMCEMTEILDHPEKFECVTCGHEWERVEAAEVPAGPKIIKDAFGNALVDGDSVTLIKDLPMKGSSGLKGGTKAKNIRLVEGDHEISCKIDGVSIGLKACFVKKA